MPRFIGNVDPTASPVNYKSVFDLRAQYQERAEDNWPTGAVNVEIKTWGAGGGGGYWGGGSSGSGGAGGFCKGTASLAAAQRFISSLGLAAQLRPRTTKARKPRVQAATARQVIIQMAMRAASVAVIAACSPAHLLLMCHKRTPW